MMMRTFIVALVSALLIAPVYAAPKNVTPRPKAQAPFSAAVMPPNQQPKASDPAGVVAISPNSPNISPLGPGTVATTPSVNLAGDQPPVATYNTAQITGGLNNYFFQPAASTNARTIVAGAHQVFKISISTNALLTSVAYIRLYNATTGFAGCGSATGLIYEAAIQPGSGLNDSWTLGLAGFTSGISLCVSGGYTTTDATNAIAAAMNVNVGWK